MGPTAFRIARQYRAKDAELNKAVNKRFIC
nr:MAG TPA: hypothetical protein [Caudoviricetes sp.]